jgi:hypothetical protein
MYHTKEVIKVTWFTRRLHHRHNYSSWALELSDKFPRVEAVAPGTWTLPNIICIYFKLVGPHFLNYARTYLHFLSFCNGIYNKLATTNESIIYIHVLWHLHLVALPTMHHHNPRLLCFIPPKSSGNIFLTTWNKCSFFRDSHLFLNYKCSSFLLVFFSANLSSTFSTQLDKLLNASTIKQPRQHINTNRQALWYEINKIDNTLTEIEKLAATYIKRRTSTWNSVCLSTGAVHRAAKLGGLQGT